MPNLQTFILKSKSATFGGGESLSMKRLWPAFGVHNPGLNSVDNVWKTIRGATEQVAWVFLCLHLLSHCYSRSPLAFCVGVVLIVEHTDLMRSPRGSGTSWQWFRILFISCSHPQMSERPCKLEIAQIPPEPSCICREMTRAMQCRTLTDSSYKHKHIPSWAARGLPVKCLDTLSYNHYFPYSTIIVKTVKLTQMEELCTDQNMLLLCLDSSSAHSGHSSTNTLLSLTF